MKKYLAIFLIIILSIAVFYFLSNKSLKNSTPIDIMIDSPKIGQIISSPFEVNGVARGSWFFEANLRVNLIDADGNIITATYGTAETEWMTNELVPFKAIVEFPPPATGTGILRILNDNPSGLPENDKSFDVPVIFDRNASEKTSIKIFLGSSRFDPDADNCGLVYKVTRIIPKTTAIAEAAINELLKGPTGDEKSAGYFSGIPSDVKLQKINLDNGVLKLDFSEELNKTAGSCRVMAIRSQIIETAKQFATIREVVISINGQTEDILQP